MKILKRLACVFAALMLLMADVSAESIDTQQNVSLSIVFQDEAAGVAGAKFSLYRVADMDAAGSITPVSPFDKYKVKLNAQSDADMADTAYTLEGYVLRDKLAPAYTGTTDENGMLAFSGGMEQGLYLVRGDRCTVNGVVYTFQPVLLRLPSWDAAAQKWLYDVVIAAKYDSENEPPAGQKISRKVLKVWEGDGHEEHMPDEIAVHLLRDGEVFDTVYLNAENLWRYTWEELDADHHWSVVEDEPGNFTVTIRRDGITFVITNTYEPDDAPPESTPTPGPGTTPPPDEPDDPKLPQTGQLWWPVGVLAFAGLMLVVMGLVRRRSS